MSQHRCVHCGYDMTGTHHRAGIAPAPTTAAPADALATCPECGKDWSREIEATAPRWPGWARFVWTCTGLQGLAMAAALLLIASAHKGPVPCGFVPNFAFGLLLFAMLAGWTAHLTLMDRLM